MNILFFGDIVGKVGRRAFAAAMPALKKKYKADVVIANLENLAHGKGLTSGTLQEVLVTGLDIGTGGNHTFSKPEAEQIYGSEPNILVRPANYPVGIPGTGVKRFVITKYSVTIINLLGEHGMAFLPSESPFTWIERWLKEKHEPADATVLDFHAETTSEKVSMGWYLDGKVTAVIGTHTHVPTADVRVLPKGTGYITDVGMVGLRDSSLGLDKDIAIQRFLTGQKVQWEVPEKGLVAINAVLLRCKNGRTTAVEKIYQEITV